VSQSEKVLQLRTNYRQLACYSLAHTNFLAIFADVNNKWQKSRQQNPTFASGLIQKKSGKNPLETTPLYINLTALGRHPAEMPVTIINRKI
jgi:hypothetical protein